jgi:nucleoside-diphosphate kinase
MTKNPIVAMAISWNNAVDIIRIMTGATNPAEALPWTIRWDFWFDFETTVIHSSDSEENAKRELKIFFKNNEILK